MKLHKSYIMAAVMAVVGLSACTGDYEQPPVPVPPGGIESIGSGEWDSPMGVYQVSLGAVNENLDNAPWVSGYIVGWIDTNVSSVMNAATARFDLPATVNTNLMMAYDPDETDWTKCISVQLPSGSVRSALNLVDHPENRRARVTIQGTTGSKYCSVYGVRSVTAYTWDTVGIEPPKTTYYRKTTSFSPDKPYVLVGGGTRISKIITGEYGYIKVADAKVKGSLLGITEDVGYFTFIESEGNYLIKQSNDKYLYMKDNFDSFNLSDQSTDTGTRFNVTINEDGYVVITNVLKDKTIQYDPQYGSFGAYSDSRGVLPELYEKVETE